MKLAETRAKSDPSGSNLAILKAATDAYEFALDPEKKTEVEADRKLEPEATKPAAAPKPASPKAAAPKSVGQKPAAPKVEATTAAVQPVQPEQHTPESQEQQPAPETETTAASDPA